MTTKIYGTLRHCVMAGMCSAAEITSLAGISDSAYASERARLNQAKWRCPYSANTNAQCIRTNSHRRLDKRVSLHCEREWIERIS